MWSWRRRTGVHVGRDGWLFWLGRRGEAAALFANNLRTRRVLRRWASLIRRRAEMSTAIGCCYVQVVVPDKLSVYDDKLTSPVVDAHLSPGLGLGRLLGSMPTDAVWVDLFGPLRRAKVEGDVYLRTDTHWTYEGCLVAVREICAAFGIVPAEHLFRAGRLPPRDFALDLGRKMSPPTTERLATATFELRAGLHEANALARFRQERGEGDLTGLHVGSRIVLRRSDECAAQLTVMLFGDSFSSETGFTLGVMLGETVRELHSVWSANIDWDYVRSVRPDILIHEVAERFLRRVPDDRISIDAFAAAKVAKIERSRTRVFRVRRAG